MTLSAVVLLLSSDAYEFSWRYQLPAVVMLPVAGALGLTALTSPDQAPRGPAQRTSLLFRPPPAVQVDEPSRICRQEQTIPLRGTDRPIR